MQDLKSRIMKVIVLVVCITVTFGFISAGISHAKTAREIDASVSASLKRFQKEVKGAEEFLKSTKGVLVFPGFIKGGLVIGGEYGEGALRIDGKTVDYYSTAAASLDTAKMNEPIVGFVFGQKGLMYNLTLEGSKFTKLKK